MNSPAMTAGRAGFLFGRVFLWNVAQQAGTHQAVQGQGCEHNPENDPKQDRGPQNPVEDPGGKVRKYGVRLSKKGHDHCQQRKGGQKSTQKQGKLLYQPVVLVFR